MAYLRKPGKRWIQRRAEIIPKSGHIRACAKNAAHQNACSEVASSDHRAARTGRSAQAVAMILRLFSFSISQTHASSQMGNAHIAPIVSGPQTKTSASNEKRLKAYRFALSGNAGMCWTTSSLGTTPSLRDLALASLTEVRNILRKIGLFTTRISNQLSRP